MLGNSRSDSCRQIRLVRHNHQRYLILEIVAHGDTQETIRTSVFSRILGLIAFCLSPILNKIFILFNYLYDRFDLLSRFWCDIFTFAAFTHIFFCPSPILPLNLSQTTKNGRI